MDSNPFDRIPDVPLSRPAAPSPVGGMEPTQLVPDYAIENHGRDGGDPDGGLNTTATELHFNNGLIQIDIDGGGVSVIALSLGPTDPIYSFSNGTVSFVIEADGDIVFNNGTATLTIDPSLLTEDMGIVEDDVCDSGTMRKRLIIASAPYGP